MQDWITILPIAATILSGVVAFYNTITYFRKNKKQKEELQSYLTSSKAFINLHKCLIDSEQLNEELVLKDFESTNNLIKKVFDDITHSNCRTTIKVISYDDSVPVVLSLVSQKFEKKSRQAIFMHKSNLFDDSSLSILFHKPFDYYLENNMERFYKNIHFPVDSIRDKDFVLYYSTLVVPIVKMEKQDGQNCIIYGFLSIDSDKKDAFKKDIHVSIAKSFTSALTPYIEAWTKKVIENKGLLPSSDVLPETT